MVTDHPLTQTKPTAFPLAAHFPTCSDCRTSIVDHLRYIVAERDRSKLGGILVEMLGDVFFTRHCALYRHVAHCGNRFVIPLAAFAAGRVQLHDAYLALPAAGSFLHDHPLLARCAAADAPLLEAAAGQHAGIIPVHRQGNLHLLVDMRRDDPFAAHDIALAQTLLSHFHDHLALIDYAETDTLTGLLNRKTFDEHLGRVLSAAATDGDVADTNLHPLRRHLAEDARNWLAVIDIDHFKGVNDTHGHLIGDEVLLLVAQMMQESFRLEDQLFRFGGEEFVAVLQPTDFANALRVLERFRQRIEAHVFPIVGTVTVSIGFTAVREYDNPPDLIDRSDKALYYAKDCGRNRVENFETLHDAGLLSSERARQKSDVELF